MDIYHRKKQTENISRSCSYLLLKTLLYFISQCTSVPYLESDLCKFNKIRSWTTAILHLFSKERDLSMKVTMKCVIYKTLGYTGLFSLHIERPSYNKDKKNCDYG